MIRRLICAVFISLLGTFSLATAQLEVIVDRADLKPTPIAIPNFEAIGVEPDVAAANQ